VGGGSGSCAFSPVVDLCGGDVAVAERLLRLADVHATGFGRVQPGHAGSPPYALP